MIGRMDWALVSSLCSASFSPTVSMPLVTSSRVDSQNVSGYTGITSKRTRQMLGNKFGWIISDLI